MACSTRPSLTSCTPSGLALESLLSTPFRSCLLLRASLSSVSGTSIFLLLAPPVLLRPATFLSPCPSSTEKPLCPQEEALLRRLALHFSRPSWNEPDPDIHRHLPVSPIGHPFVPSSARLLLQRMTMTMPRTAASGFCGDRPRVGPWEE